MKWIRSAGVSILLAAGTFLLGQTAAQALHDKNYALAESLAREALAKRPDDSKALVNLGLALEGEAKFDEAIGHWESLRGRSEKGLPTPAQLTQRVRDLLAKVGPNRKYRCALINIRGNTLEAAFATQVTEASSPGFHERFGLVNYPDGAPTPYVLETRNLPDGGVQVRLNDPSPRGKTLMDHGGKRQADGKVQVRSADYLLLLDPIKDPTWKPTVCTRHTWVASGFGFQKDLDVPIHAWGGNDGYFLPPYGFGGTLTVDDGAFGCTIVYSLLPQAWLYTWYWKLENKVYPVFGMKEQGDFFYLTRKGKIFIDQLKAREKMAPTKRMIQALLGAQGNLTGLEVYAACGFCPTFEPNTGLGITLEPRALDQVEKDRILARFASPDLLAAMGDAQAVALAPWEGTGPVRLPDLFPQNMLFYNPDPASIQFQVDALKDAPSRIGAASKAHDTLFPRFGPMGSPSLH